MKKIEDIKKKILKQTEERLNVLLLLCESPIEQQFLVELFESFYEVANSKVEYICTEVVPENEGTNKMYFKEKYDFVEANQCWRIIGIRLIWLDYRFDVFPQYKVNTEDQNYRLDFAIFCYSPKHRPKGVLKFAVECDGFEHHYANVNQINKDHKKVFRLMKEGWQTIRFTGNAIYNNGQECVDSISSIITTKVSELGSDTSPSMCYSEFDQSLTEDFKKMIRAGYQ